jgi:hypothetical protein
MRKMSRLSFVLFAALLLSILTSSPAMALCYAECPDGSWCSGWSVCCCLDDMFPYCGPIKNNPCLAATTTSQDADLQASYNAIFATAPSSSPEAVKTESK